MIEQDTTPLDPTGNARQNPNLFREIVNPKWNMSSTTDYQELEALARGSPKRGNGLSVMSC